jgi:nucleoside-diphosphate-sugar epimerase
MVTIFGATGFVGSNLKDKLVSLGIITYLPKRGEEMLGKNLGHVIYCIGLTADFRTKPFETVEAHVCYLSEVLQKCQFESFTYLSSTRLYIKTRKKEGKINEEDNIVLNSNDPEDIFGSSKILGELLLLNSGRDNVKIVRLSNVFGSDLTSRNFLNSIIRDAIIHKKVELFTTPDSSKDYISIEEVCDALVKIIFLIMVVVG